MSSEIQGWHVFGAINHNITCMMESKHSMYFRFSNKRYTVPTKLIKIYQQQKTNKINQDLPTAKDKQN